MIDSDEELCILDDEIFLTVFDFVLWTAFCGGEASDDFF